MFKNFLKKKIEAWEEKKEMLLVENIYRETKEYYGLSDDELEELKKKHEETEAQGNIGYFYKMAKENKSEISDEEYTDIGTKDYFGLTGDELEELKKKQKVSKMKELAEGYYLEVARRENITVEKAEENITELVDNIFKREEITPAGQELIKKLGRIPTNTEFLYHFYDEFMSKNKM